MNTKTNNRFLLIIILSIAFFHCVRCGANSTESGKINTLIELANTGDANAQFNLGMMYSSGRGVPRNDVEAVKWFRKAAEQNNVQAQLTLGNMYSSGRGVPRNDAEAVKWLRKAAKQNNVQAQLTLGIMYSTECGVPRNDAEAVKWFRKAAEQNDAQAQCLLGGMYLNGKGVPRNKVTAYKWLNLAAMQNETAINLRDSLAKMMTPKEITEAKRLSSDFLKSLKSKQRQLQ